MREMIYVRCRYIISLSIPHNIIWGKSFKSGANIVPLEELRTETGDVIIEWGPIEVSLLRVRLYAEN